MRLTRTERRAFAAAALFTVISAALYCSWPLGFLLNPEAMRDGLASELGAFGQPYNWVFIWGDIVSGVLLVAGVSILIRLYDLAGWAKWAMVCLAIYGICGALDAALPESCVPSERICGPILSDPMLILHGIFDLAASIALIGTLVAAAIFVHKVEPSPRRRTWTYIIGAGGTIFALASGIFFIWGGPGYWAQRYYITLSCVWVASMPFVLKPRRAIMELLEQ
jgi:hypothetical protein